MARLIARSAGGTPRENKWGSAMRDDVMIWIGRLVAAVFLLGLLALVAATVALVQRADGVPPLPIFAALIGTVVLILLSGACLALLSLAVSARRGVRALEALAAEGTPEMAVEESAVAPEPEAPVQGPFKAPGLREAAMAAPARPARPAGRVLVAER